MTTTTDTQSIVDAAVSALDLETAAAGLSTEQRLCIRVRARAALTEIINSEIARPWWMDYK